jgi:hypothetical protein
LRRPDDRSVTGIAVDDLPVAVGALDQIVAALDSDIFPCNAFTHANAKASVASTMSRSAPRGKSNGNSVQARMIAPAPRLLNPAAMDDTI